VSNASRTITTTPAPTQTLSGHVGDPGFRDLLRSEWTKLRSVRSTVWALVALVLLTIGFTSLLTWLTTSQWDAIDVASRQQVIADPTSQILGSGFQFSQLAICVLGVLVMTSEYSSGTIRASLLAVPARTPMLAAKAIVFAVLVFVVAEIAAFPSFFIGSAILHSRAPVSLTDAGVLRAVVGVGLYIAMLGVFAVAIGTLVRHTAGAITGIIGFVLVLSPLALLLPGTVGAHIHAYLPTVAGQQLVTTVQAPDQLLGPWQGFGVFALWTAALMALAGYALTHRDA
jgi:ABC-type transport system involved in multi-copper enzyme maturation permease subunit